MYGMWLSLRENINCGCNTRDIHWPEKVVKNKTQGIEREENSARELLMRTENPVNDIIFWRHYNRKRLCELNLGDPSRNIIERIFQAASVKSSKDARKIERVLKVKNSVESLARFEEYRDMVKKNAHEQYKRHPRSIVDGNELLRFYSTTMSCCSTKENKVSELCLKSTCGVCRIIESGFQTEDMKRNGIRLSTSSETSTDVVAVKKGEKWKRAVVVCRVIAGKVINLVDGESDEGFDSVGSGGLCCKLEHLLVRNSSAVLPCFVVVCA